MASGSISANVISNGGIVLYLDWSESSTSVANNTSSVYWQMRLATTSYYSINTSNSRSWTCTINGTTHSGTANYSVGTGSSLIFASSTDTITHNNDGSKTFSLSFSCNFSGITVSSTALGTISASGTGTLTTIARASTPTLSATTVDFGKSVTIYTNRASTSFTHSVYARLGSNAYGNPVATGVTDSYSYTLPSSWVSSVTTSTKETVTILLRTYSNGTAIGDKTITLTGTVPSSVVPTVSDPTITDGNTVAKGLGIYVQNRSSLTIKPNVSGVSGSTVSSYTVTFNGTTKSNGSLTRTPSTSGSLPIVTTVTDSRGRTASKTYYVTVLAYSAPTLTGTSVHRCGSDGTTSSDGTYIRVIGTSSISSLNSKNTASISFTWNGNTYSLTSGTASIIGDGLVDVAKSYVTTLSITDKFSTTTYTNTIPTDEVTINFRNGGKGVGIGKYSEKDGAVQSAWKIEAPNLELYSATPYIDFHYGSSSDDYTSRIVDTGALLNITSVTGAEQTGSVQIGTSSHLNSLYVSNNIHASGRVYCGGRTGSSDYIGYRNAVSKTGITWASGAGWKASVCDSLTFGAGTWLVSIHAYYPKVSSAVVGYVNFNTSNSTSQGISAGGTIGGLLNTSNATLYDNVMTLSLSVSTTYYTSMYCSSSSVTSAQVLVEYIRIM